ncbi:CO dehydrogenase/CO-methylating acetyl-CoA synthase complex subunit beta, partial [Candidatus Bathyarchaeota archaeon]|nr:CO dehydrogenase/CO-methylating acetyl-CoA synthase complex subunit beta [Candidatus Bathyarchaeota archaeon]
IILCKSLMAKGEKEEKILNNGLASLMALEIIESINYAFNKELKGFISDTAFREVSLELADGTIPGIVVLTGLAKADSLAEELIKEIQEANLLCLTSGLIINQIEKIGVKFGLEEKIIPLGSEFTSIIHAINLIVRTPLMFGGVKPGDKEAVIAYIKERVPAFAVILGKLDNKSLAVAIGLTALGIPVIIDQLELKDLPMLTTQLNYEKIIETGCNAKKIELKKLVKPLIPIEYGTIYEGEKIRKPDVFVEFGGGKTPAFEIVKIKSTNEVEDGLIKVDGLEIQDMKEGECYPLGIIVELAGSKLEETLEPVLERRIHKFLNQGKGIMHLGSRDEIWIRISKEAAQKNLKIKHLGEILHFMFRSSFPRLIEKTQVIILTRSSFPRLIEKTQVIILTNPIAVEEKLNEARKIYKERDSKIKELTEESVDCFYGCTLCQSFAPTHVCVITPQRISLCGATSWLDASISYRLDPSGPNFPINKGNCIDPVKGEWSGVNEAVKMKSHNSTTKVYLHSIFGYPHTSCGCFQAIAFYIPEVDGIGIVDRSFRELAVNGMSFPAMAGFCSGGKQVEGFLGIGIEYIKSRKFLKADGGLNRIVWIPKALKEKVKDAIPNELYDKIATENEAKNLEELKFFLKKVNHPALRKL